MSSIAATGLIVRNVVNCFAQRCIVVIEKQISVTGKKIGPSFEHATNYVNPTFIQYDIYIYSLFYIFSNKNIIQKNVLLYIALFDAGAAQTR